MFWSTPLRPAYLDAYLLANAYTYYGTFILLATYLLFRFVKQSRALLPPGPRGFPILGNILDTSRSRPLWVQFKEISNRYGSDVICLKYFGTVVIVANTLEATQDLLVKRGSIYSDKPILPLVKLVSFEWAFPMRQYDDETWRVGRKLFRQEVDGKRSMLRSEAEKCSRKLMKCLLDLPDDFHQHLRSMAGELILTSTYGLNIQPVNDPHIRRSEQFFKETSDAFNPAFFIVSLIPSLQRFPWVRNKMAHWKALSHGMRDKPFEFLQRSMSSGAFKSSVGSRAIASIRDEKGDHTEDMARLADVLGSMFAGGSDTTVSALLSFFLVMSMHPEIQRRAQITLDTVTGGYRLPTFSDRESLPFVEALVKEVLRVNPVGPMASPHATSQDDTFNGWLIPKGSIVIGNSWAILRDEKIYGLEPARFNPERFLNEDGSLNRMVPDPDVAFGYGRRACPGKSLPFVQRSQISLTFRLAIALDSIWITVALILSVLNISGNESIGILDNEALYTKEFISRPLPFTCRIRPRSETKKALILDSI